MYDSWMAINEYGNGRVFKEYKEAWKFVDSQKEPGWGVWGVRFEDNGTGVVKFDGATF